MGLLRVLQFLLPLGMPRPAPVKRQVLLPPHKKSQALCRHHLYPLSLRLRLRLEEEGCFGKDGDLEQLSGRLLRGPQRGSWGCPEALLQEYQKLKILAMEDWRRGHEWRDNA